MTDHKTASKKPFSLDWLMRGVLTKIGETLDRFTGRHWKPSSSLATSELIERLKTLLDAEVKDLGVKGRFVPHNIKLKMQWDKFSADADTALRRLENELTVAAIDHINDNRYHTFAPIKVEVKPDYFTEGVKLLASFEKFDQEEREVAINVTVPQIKVGDFVAPAEPASPALEEPEIVRALFEAGGQPKQIEITFRGGQRRSVGRNKGNDLVLEDPSVSKVHAALVINSEKQLLVADTGSTNGTFVNDQRIAYGKAIPIRPGDRVKFGTVDVVFEQVPGADAESTTPPVVSQKDIQTVAFQSDQDVAFDQTIQTPGVAENDGRTEEPANGADDSPGPRQGTEDRIVYDFSNDE